MNSPLQNKFPFNQNNKKPKSRCLFSYSGLVKKPKSRCLFSYSGLVLTSFYILLVNNVARKRSLIL